MRNGLKVSIAAFSLLPIVAFSQIQINFSTGYITIPDSSIEKPTDIGLRAHTNYKIYTPYKITADNLPGGETPASLACVYGLTSPKPGCPIANTSALPNSGWGVIAIVDAYDNPSIENDLAIFSSQFGLPACTTGNGCFQKIYASGSPPIFNPDWAIEEALDVEWAHAMAPNARIVLVEADTSSTEDLFAAEDVATLTVQANGGGEVSNSWGESEFPGETTLDVHFQNPGVVYLASSGDDGAPADYPSSSPNVVSAGGTSINRTNGNFVSETAWNYYPARGWGGSGGQSIYEMRPSYQLTVQKIVGTQRGTPDISFDANPFTGVDVYTASHGWIIVGGTSVSSPSLAGIINSANMRFASSNQELTFIYNSALKNYHAYWHDIVQGNNNGHIALIGYDLTTGLGSPLGYQGK